MWIARHHPGVRRPRAAGWFLAGVAVFKLSERTAKRRGALSRY